MKKILLVLIFILIYFFKPVYLYSQTPTPALDYSLTIPNVNCGIASDPKNNKCCHIYYPQVFNPPDLGPLNTIVDLLYTKTAGYVQYYFIQPIFNAGNELIGKKTEPCIEGIPSENNYFSQTCKCIKTNITPSPSYLSSLNGFCQRQEKQNEKISCLECANNGGVYTGIGCVYTDIKKFIQDFIFKIGLGLAGGFSLLCIIYAAFMMQSSQGNPEKLKKAQEMITSCIMGLMLIIFSVFILRLIGVNILQIRGFN